MNDYYDDLNKENDNIEGNDNFEKNSNTEENGNIWENDPGSANTAIIPHYYTERYNKPRKWEKMLRLVLIPVLCAVLGGSAVGAFFTFIAPAVQASKGSNSNFSNQAQNSGLGSYKDVDIVQGGEAPVAAIAEKVGPSVVGVKVTFESQNWFSANQQQVEEGSGIIIRSDGYILTNNHVVTDAVNQTTKTIDSSAKIEVYLPNQNDKPYAAKLVGTDAKTDLAVLKIDAANLQAAVLGDSDKLKVGELAVAIGNPGGLEFAGSVTVGVISGLNRSVTADNGVNMKLIQTDAAINPGNSGGALVNGNGEVIGVNQMKIAAQGFEGLGFAIPINLAKGVINDLIQYKYVKGRPFLGISTDPRYTEAYAQANNLPAGVYVADVQLMSSAQKAGIQPGDIITKFDGQSVKSADELNAIKDKHKVGDTVAVELYRDGATKTVSVALGEDKG